jgi:hypothetical protein
MAAWLMAVQVLLVAFSPTGRWQWPGIAKATVLRIDWDPETQRLTGGVLVREGVGERAFRMAVAEAAELEVDQEAWILHNYFADGLRPSAFRLGPLRLLLEYPLLVAGPALWGIRRLRRAQARALQAARDAAPAPRVWKDEFHLKAQRFANPGDSEGPPAGDQTGPFRGK